MYILRSFRSLVILKRSNVSIMMPCRMCGLYRTGLCLSKSRWSRSVNDFLELKHDSLAGTAKRESIGNLVQAWQIPASEQSQFLTWLDAKGFDTGAAPLPGFYDLDKGDLIPPFNLSQAKNILACLKSKGDNSYPTCDLLTCIDKRCMSEPQLHTRHPLEHLKVKPNWYCQASY